MAENALNDTARLFQTISKIGFFCGLPNVCDVNTFEYIKRYHNSYRVVTNVILLVFLCSQWGAFLTQDKLTEKQRIDRLLFNLSQPLLFMYVVAVEYHKTRITEFQHELTVVLKEVHNDADVEKQLMWNVKKHSAGFSAMLLMALIFYGYNGTMQVIHGEGTFTTVITFWPDVEDRSLEANFTRIIAYIVWWMFMGRVGMVFNYVIATVLCLSHQFKNLQSYFLSLNEIFQEDLEQIEKENKYQEAFKVGIEMHSKTLWCTRECQVTYNVIFGCQVLFVLGVLVLLMGQMVNLERTLENVLNIVADGATALFSTGFFMWNAGDVTVEAEEMATTLYASGWHNCHLSAPKIRRLVVIGMTQCQKPVVFSTLGILELSYRSYVTIVKSSYSAFSLIF